MERRAGGSLVSDKHVHQTEADRVRSRTGYGSSPPRGQLKHLPAGAESSRALRIRIQAREREAVRAPEPTRSKWQLRTLVLVGFCLVAVLSFAAIRYGPAHQVVQFVLATTDLGVEIDGPATLNASRRADIGSEMVGRINVLAVERGQVVAAGDVLAEIEPETATKALEAAVAAEQAAEIGVRQATAAKQVVEADRANLLKTFERRRTLVARGTVSEADFDNAESALAAAEAELLNAAATVDLAVANRRAAVAETALQRAYLARATIRAPFDGVVVNRERDVGDVVGVGETILSLVDPGTMVWSMRVDESAIARLRPGQDVRISVVGAPEVNGTLTRIFREVDKETREITLDVTPRELPEQWAVGQRANAAITIEVKPDVLAVPTPMLAPRGRTQGVRIDDDGRARWRPVELGALGDGRVEIRSGLAAGDVVIDGPRLFAGMRVDGPPQ